ncbi:MAG: hypothetical protein ACUVWX_09100 [Kiritimatiellia bacterium]
MTTARIEECNCSRSEVRLLQTCSVTPEQVCFPAAAQAGQLYRKIGKHRTETVWVLTSRETERMQAQRDYLGIEAGLNQSLEGHWPGLRLVTGHCPRLTSHPS